MKKFLVLILCFVSIIFVTSCNKETPIEDEKTTVVTPNNPDKETPTINPDDKTEVPTQNENTQNTEPLNKEDNLYLNSLNI